MEEQLVVLLDPWRDKYDRMLEAHEKLQKLNQSLEEKLLKLAEDYHAETTRLSHQAQDLTQRLVEARIYIHQLEDENDRYRSDINVVVQLLHCKPSNFVSPKLETLPDDLQRKVLGIRNGSNCKKEKKIIKVQVPTFPPTDIMYAVDKGKGKKNSEKDIVSAAIMAKILQERENERKENRKNRCKCASYIVLPTVDQDTQTLPVCTISYSNFNFSDFEEGAEEEEDPEDDEDNQHQSKQKHDGSIGGTADGEIRDKVSSYDFTSSTRQKAVIASASNIMPSTSSYVPKITAINDGYGDGSSSNVSSDYHHAASTHQEPPSPSTSHLPGNPSGKTLCSLSSYTSSVDDIMKQDEKEEELLPTPLFRRKELKSDDSHHQTSSSCHKSLEEQQLGSPILHHHHHQHQQHHINNHQHHHNANSSFPSPSSMSSAASPVSSTDMPHSSICSGSADGVTNFSSLSSDGGGGIILQSASASPSDVLGMRGSLSGSNASLANSGSGSGTGSRKQAVVPGRPVSMNLTSKDRDRTWEKLTSPTESFRNGLVSHWRSTVLVHQPPKSHTYEPLSLMHSTTTTTGSGEGGGRQTTTTFGVTGDELESSSDEQPLLIHTNLNTYANIASNPVSNTSQQSYSSQQPQSSSSTAQYYRAQKRTFWTRSSSTTSTETEI